MSERGDRERQDEAEDVGKDGYPVIWHELKHEVRERAGHRCVRCGHPYRNGEHERGEWSRCDEGCTHLGPVRANMYPGVPAGFEYRWRPVTFTPRYPTAGAWARYCPVEARWRILTVHHLDGDKTNLRWWNLVALCQRCHLRVQGTVQMARVYPWPHTEWFKPYVAGYYAWTYLGEELDRQAVEARLDELLALELASSASPAQLGAAPSSKAKP